MDVDYEWKETAVDAAEVTEEKELKMTGKRNHRGQMCQRMNPCEPSVEVRRGEMSCCGNQVTGVERLPLP